MKKIFSIAVAVSIAAWFSIGAAFAQSSPNLTFGQVLTPAQWNQLFINKQDTLGFTPLNTGGGVMLGSLITAPSTSVQAGFNIPPGVAPGSPNNGDIWVTSTGVFAQINGATVGPFLSASAACAGCAVTNVTNNFTANQTFSAQLIETGTSAPTSAAGQTVILGTLANGGFTLPNTGQAVFFNTTIGGAVINGSGSTNDFTLHNNVGTPVMVVPTGTQQVQLPGSLAVGGVAVGTNAFSVTGSSAFTGAAIFTGATFTQAVGQVVIGTFTTGPVLTGTNQQAVLLAGAVNGATLQGIGTTNDVALNNSAGSTVVSIPTGTTKLNIPGLATVTCVSSIVLDASNNTGLGACPGASASIAAGTTLVTGGPGVLFNTTSGGTLGSATTIPFAISVTGALTATSPPSTSAANQYAFTVATGTLALNTTAIAPDACNTQSATATGTTTSDEVDFSFSADPTGTTGYIPPNMLALIPFPTANTFNVRVCNNTAVTITPGAAVNINWRVRR
jgi:hypothetical protein